MSERCERRKFGFWGFTALVAVVAAAIYAGSAIGKPGLHGWGHGPWGHHQAMTEDDLKDFSEFVVKRFSRRVDATDDQRAAIKKAVDANIPKILELRDKKTALHERLIAALEEEKVDKAKLEAAREDGLELARETTGLLVDTAADVANILTPQQRKELVGEIRQRHGG
ncbi:MAG: periplasmic heavy metal sensor [Nitrospinota bacterium]|nr:periplasmic heavy metal sensor [Nitrospinota bacterium]